MSNSPYHGKEGLVWDITRIANTVQNYDSPWTTLAVSEWQGHFWATVERWKECIWKFEIELQRRCQIHPLCFGAWCKLFCVWKLVCKPVMLLVTCVMTESLLAAAGLTNASRPTYTSSILLQLGSTKTFVSPDFFSLAKPSSLTSSLSSFFLSLTGANKV